MQENIDEVDDYVDEVNNSIEWMDFLLLLSEKVYSNIELNLSKDNKEKHQCKKKI